MSIVLGISILTNSSIQLTGFTLLACSIGVLIFSLRTNRIGTNNHSNKPQLLIFIMVLPRI
jgi:FtsH-binding integral membrane protein